MQYVFKLLCIFHFSIHFRSILFGVNVYTADLCCLLYHDCGFEVYQELISITSFLNNLKREGSNFLAVISKVGHGTH